MAQHNQLGVSGEQFATEYLSQKGYKILNTNWRFRKAEVDIIAEKGQSLIFIEVKTRSTDYFGAPSESVMRKKQELLAEAAEAYLEQHELSHEIQFDIVSIIKSKKGIVINHIPSAFLPQVP